ncbi:MAG TPA: hypothetical protein VLI90_11050 [Tepidisphaeraceae bacterium]|nr:hypothetical protein [Tepidisphaeraceae bacterium]
MKAWKLAVAVIGLSPLFGRAEVPAPPTADEVAALNPPPAPPAPDPRTASPAPAPGSDGNGGGGFRGGFGGYGGRWGPWGRLLPGDVYSPQDVEQATPWFKDHSPKRWAVVSALPDEGRRKMRLTGALMRVYRNVQTVQKDDPDLAQLITNRVELEDAAFDLVSQYRAAKKAGDTSKQAALQHDREQKVSDLVDVNIKERRARIARLEKTLAQEQTKLADDEKSKDQLVEKRLRSLIDGQPAPDGAAGTDSNQPDQVGSVQR